MRKLICGFMVAFGAVLAGCSGGSDNTLVGDGSGVPGGPTSVASLTLLTSSPTIPSNGSQTVTISALVRDANNVVMEGVPVSFNASSGSLAVSQPASTDANGVLTATLSAAGDPSVRTITVTGSAGSTQASVDVSVTGVTISVSGPKSLVLGGQETYTVRVTDDPIDGDPVAGADVTLSSAAGNTITPVTTNLTDSKGEVQFRMTAASGGSDTLTATALGATSSPPLAVTVSTDSFLFTTPNPASPPIEIALGFEQQVTVQWSQGAGQNITFSSSRGAFTDCNNPAQSNPLTVAADGSGTATVCVVANNAGPAVITATNAADTSIQASVEFVATTPATLDLQASPFTLVPAGQTGPSQSSITAVVRDANQNLVKNQVVSFTLFDTTGGSLSVAQATTNSQGRAQTVYSSSTATSAVDGVRIDATVQGFPAATDSVNLTVAQRELFISIGTGNEIEEPNTAQYRKEWIVQVTDAQGNGVPNAQVTFSVLSTRYWDGFRQWNGNVWETILTSPVLGCTDEDTLLGDPDFDRNGILDLGEDNNGNGKIEAGNIASAVPQGGSGSTLTTDENGFGIIDLYWPQEYAFYLEVVLEARTSVSGSEFSASSTFVLTGSNQDFNNEDTTPPGPISPFGLDGDCATPPPL